MMIRNKMLFVAALVIVASAAVYFLTSAYLDSYGKSVFCREDVLMTSLGKCRPGGPISITGEPHESMVVIALGEPVDYEGLVPITTTQITTSNHPITKIIDRTFHPTNYGDRQPDEFGSSWDLVPNPLRIEMRIVDQNNNDVIDRSKASYLGRIQPLYMTSISCEGGHTEKILYGAAVIVPIKEKTHAVHDTNRVDGLLPNEKNQYILSFASFFKQEVILPDAAIVQSHTSQTCTTDIRNHESAYYDRVVFEMENPVQEYIPPAISFETDKESYFKNETIMISGSVRGIIPYDEMVLQVIGPVEKNIIHIDLIEFEGDERFAKSIKTEGPLWDQDGTYIVKIQYGKDVMAEQEIVLTIP